MRNKKLLLFLLVSGGILYVLYFFIFTSDLKQKKISDLDKANSHVIVGLGSEPRTLDPRIATDANGMRIGELLFQSLVRVGDNLKIYPDAAQRWSYKNKTYTFYVPQNLTFSNNRKIKKQDILFSFQEYRSPKNFFYSAFKIIDSVSVQQQKSFFVVKIKLNTLSAKFLHADLPILKILPQQELQNSPELFKKTLIGTGAFKFISRNSSQIILKARLDVRSAPKIKQVTFKIIRDDFTRFQKMLNQEIDILQSEISFKKINIFLNKPEKFKVVRKIGLSMTYLLMNLRDKCLQKKNMRKLIYVSLDPLSVIKYKLNNFAQPAFTILNPDNFFFNPILKQKKNLLKPSTLFNQLDIFCRQKIFLFKTSSNKATVSYAKVLALQLKKQNLKIKIESFEWGTFYHDLQTKKWDLVLLKWVGVIDPDIYRLAFSSKEYPSKGRNRSFYTNFLLDQLLNQGIQTMNRQKRREIYYRVQKIIQEDFVFIPLWHEEQITVLQKNILNYSLSDRGDFRYLIHIYKKTKGLLL